MISTCPMRLAAVDSRQQVDGRNITNITYIKGFDGMIFVFARRRLDSLASASEMGDVVPLAAVSFFCYLLIDRNQKRIWTCQT